MINLQEILCKRESVNVAKVSAFRTSSEICFCFVCVFQNIGQSFKRLPTDNRFPLFILINVFLILLIIYETKISNISVFAIVTHEFHSIIF